MNTLPGLIVLGEKINQEEERGMHGCLISTSIHSYGQIPSLHHSREKSTENKWKWQSIVLHQCPCVTWGWLFSMGR